MSNIIDYMEWRGDVPLNACGFNEIDNIILASVTFVDFGGIVPEGIDAEPISFEGSMRAFERVSEERKYLGVLQPSYLLDVARAAAKCPRFKETRLVGFVNEVDEAALKQFSAVTFLLDDGSIYVAFRGTDDTIVGWKEDFTMGFQVPIPAHTRAVEYLEQVAETYSGAIMVGGHSKGGNIAMWAAANCNDATRGRIVTAYNNDGPGFLPEVIQSDKFKDMADRIVTFVPQSSVVGMLLDQSPICHIIKSTQIGILQHDPMSWEVKGTKFVYVDKRARSVAQSDEKTKKWLYSMEPAQRQKIMETMFAVIESTGAKTLTDLADAKLKNFSLIMRSLRSWDKETRAMMGQAMITLLGARPSAPEQSQNDPKAPPPLPPAEDEEQETVD